MNRGDRVEVREDGIRPWSGVVKAIKPAKRGAFFEIERDDTDHECWIVHERDVTEVEFAQTSLGWGA